MAAFEPDLFHELAGRVEALARDLQRTMDESGGPMTDPVALAAHRQVQAELSRCAGIVHGLGRFGFQAQQLEGYEEGRIESGKLRMRRGCNDCERG